MESISAEISDLKTGFIQENEFQVQVEDVDNPTVRELAESHVKMANQMKRMQEIFVNSLKINEKLHSKIVQAESSVSKESASLSSMVSSNGEKIEEQVRRSKELYEDTVHQNQKARFLLEQFMTPIRQELKSKVDETTFSLQLKMLLDEYDQMGHKITYENQRQQKQEEERKKTISSETLTFLKDKVLPLLSDLEHKLNSSVDSLDRNQERVELLETRLRLLSEELEGTKAGIVTLEEKMLREINAKTGEGQIETKVKEYGIRFMDGFRQSIEMAQKRLQRNLNNLQRSFSMHQDQFSKLFNSVVTSQKSSDNVSRSQVEKINLWCQELKREMEVKETEGIKLKESVSKLQNQLQQSRSSQKMEEMLKKLETQMASHLKEYAEADLKESFSGNYSRKCLKLEQEVRSIKQNLKPLQEKIANQSGELIAVRDLLSKKANFSDVIRHVECKVDRIEFRDFLNKSKQIESRLQLQRKNLESEAKIVRKSSSVILKETQVTENNNRIYRKAHSRHKSFFSPSQQEAQNQETKRFKLGVSKDFGTPQSYESYESPRNKSSSKIFSKTSYNAHPRHSVMRNHLLASELSNRA